MKQSINQNVQTQPNMYYNNINNQTNNTNNTNNTNQTNQTNNSNKGPKKLMDLPLNIISYRTVKSVERSKKPNTSSSKTRRHNYDGVPITKAK